jgi:hypothetical protein
MRKDIGSDPERVRCEACGAEVPSYDIVNYGSIEDGYRKLCTKCFNAEVASRIGLEEFENVHFDQIEMTDRAGKAHEFHFRTRLLGSMVSLEAFELKRGAPGGYQFQILGDPEDDLLSLLGRLVERMRRSLAVRHIESSEHGTRIVDKTVRAQIDWDETMDGRVPLLIIDGQEVSWDEFGEMLMTFEGWRFRLELGDKSEEL